jgi:hypothetical protein
VIQTGTPVLSKGNHIGFGSVSFRERWNKKLKLLS